MVHKPQLVFYLLLIIPACLGNGFYTMGTFFPALTPLTAGFLKLKGNCLRSVWHALRRSRILARILERVPIG